MIEAPYYPIVYVRGFAGSRDSMENTVATPYMGFNVGSTKFKRNEQGSAEAWVFESRSSD